MSNSETFVQPWRHKLFLAVVGLFAVVVFGRAFVLQVQQKSFLQEQGAARQQRTIPVAANRGRILDRNQTPLAVSTPISSVWADPRKLRNTPERIEELAEVLGQAPQRVADVIDRAPENRGFVYLARHVDPLVAKNISALKVDGVNLQREYRRYYPSGEVASHVLGSTNIDGKGIEGLEALWNESLVGTPGERRVIRDLKGRAFSEIEYINKERRVKYWPWPISQLSTPIQAQARKLVVVVTAR